MKSHRAGLVLALGVVCLLLASACASTPPRYTGPPSAPSTDLHLRAGDVVSVKFTYWPELDEEQAVRPDGRMSLPLVGEVAAEGLTPEELHVRLLDLYADKLVDPEINVVVRALVSHRVFVGGEVKAPGEVPLQGHMTALEAVMHAGGFLKESACLSNVVVVRRQGDRQVSTALDLSQPLEEAESAPFYLEPFDVVYVPRTAIDRVDQWVDQYVNKIIPRNLHYSFSHIVEDGEDEDSNTFGSLPIQPRITLSPSP